MCVCVCVSIAAYCCIIFCFALQIRGKCVSSWQMLQLQRHLISPHQTQTSPRLCVPYIGLMLWQFYGTRHPRLAIQMAFPYYYIGSIYKKDSSTIFILYFLNHKMCRKKSHEDSSSIIHHHHQLATAAAPNPSSKYWFPAKMQQPSHLDILYGPLCRMHF